MTPKPQLILKTLRGNNSGSAIFYALGFWLAGLLRKTSRPKMLSLIFIITWIALAIRPKYPRDWILENLLVIAAVPVIYFAGRKNYFSNTTFLLIFIYLMLHIAGAHYTYAENPIGRIIGRWFGWKRNHYDRIVHFLFGLLLTQPVFEIVNRHISSQKGWKYAFSFAIIFSAGSIYELIEWLTALVVSPELGTAYLGTQGDEWDAQKDMAFQLLGSLGALGILSIKDFRAGQQWIPKKQMGAGLNSD